MFNVSPILEATCVKSQKNNLQKFSFIHFLQLKFTTQPLLDTQETSDVKKRTEL